MNFESLPAELLLHTMLQVESPEQLQNLISASPSCFQVFSKSSSIILTSLIENSVHPIALPILNAIANVPEYTEETLEVFYEGLPAFIDDYFTPGAFSLPIDKIDLMRLYRIADRVNGFAHGYFQHAMHLISVIDPREPSTMFPDEHESGADAPSPDASLSPSESEMARMQRAFLRFELYCRMFPPYDLAEGGSLMLGDDQFELFLSRLSTWEVEEISCAHHYLATVVGNAIDNLSEEFVEAILTAQSAYNRDEEARSNAPEGPGYNFGVLFLRNSIFTQPQTTDEQLALSYMTSLGINLVHQVAHGEGETPRKLIRENYPATREFLPEALAHAVRGDDTGLTVEPENFDDNDLEVGNFGYYNFKTVSADVYLQISFQGKVNLPLRELGYVFWDSARFRDFSVYRLFMRARTPHKEDMLVPAMRRRRPSGDSRLNDITLPMEEIERVEREFGTLVYHPVSVSSGTHGDFLNGNATREFLLDFGADMFQPW